MLSETAFESLIDGTESTLVDFKSANYDFAHDVDYKETAKFVKDVLSFCNTIRISTAYIIIGISENHDGTRNLIGLDRNIDDAILQDKAKDTLYPRPVFNYYVLTYKQMLFGIIEFPITKYAAPIVATRKMKGIEIGKVYYRRNTANTEALSLEVIKINDWLRDLPDINEGNSFLNDVSALIKRLTSGEEKLSVIFADILKLAKIKQLESLKKFAMEELQGPKRNLADLDEDEIKYRIHVTLISPHKVSINHYFQGAITANHIKQEMDKDGSGFFSYRFLFSQSLSQIEDYLFFKVDGIAVIEITRKMVFGDLDDDSPVYVYIFKDTWSSIYGNIRQKAIDKLIKS